MDLPEDGAQGINYAVVNKVKKEESKECIIKNEGFEDETVLPVNKKKKPPPLDLETQTQPQNQPDNQYEAPWSAKFRSLNRQSKISEPQSPTDKEYDDVLNTLVKNEAKAQPDDQYEAPWSAKYRSLSRKSATFDEGTASTPPIPIYDDTVVRKREKSEESDNQYETPWSAKYRSLRKSATLEGENGMPNLYDDTVIVKKPDSSSPVATETPDSTYEAPWRSSKHFSLTRNSQSFDISEIHSRKGSSPVDIPSKDEGSNDTYETPWSSKYRSLNRSSLIGSESEGNERNGKPSGEKENGATTPSTKANGQDNDEEDFVLNEYETLTSIQKKVDPSLIVSEYDELCIPQSKTKTDENPTSKQNPANPEDEYSVPFDSREKRRHLSDSSKPIVPQSRQRIKSVPNRSLLSTSTPTIPENSPLQVTADKDTYSIPFGSLNSAPAAGNVGVLIGKSKTLSNSQPSPDHKKKRHQSIGEGENKKERKGLLHALKLNKRKDGKSKPTRSQSEDKSDSTDISSSTGPECLYETIPTALSKRTPQTQSDYSSPADSTSPSSPPLPPIPPIPPTRSSVADKSNAAFLETVKSPQKGELKTSTVNGPEETYSDPFDSIAKVNASSKTTTTSQKTPLPYEAPVQSSAAKDSSVEKIKPYDVMIVGNIGHTNSSSSLEEKLAAAKSTESLYEEPAVSPAHSSGNEGSLSGKGISGPYEIPVQTPTSDSSATLVLDVPNGETPATTKNKEGIDYQNPAVPHPYEIPVSTKTDDGKKEVELGTLEPHSYEIPISTKTDDNATEEDQSTLRPLEPHPYEIPVNTIAEDEVKSSILQPAPHAATPLEPHPYEIPISTKTDNAENEAESSALQPPLPCESSIANNERETGEGLKMSSEPESPEELIKEH